MLVFPDINLNFVKVFYDGLKYKLNRLLLSITIKQGNLYREHSRVHTFLQVKKSGVPQGNLMRPMNFVNF